MPKQSAGLLLHRTEDGHREVFLVHPGGPFWAKKDDGVWSIPKGEFTEDEEPLAAARRELTEETGFTVDGPFVALDTVKLAGGKLVHAFAAEAPGLDPAQLKSNTFEIEWPPRSGKKKAFPEVDRAAWFGLAEAKRKMHPAQAAWLEQLGES